VKYTVLISVDANRALFWNLGYWIGSSIVMPSKSISQLSSVVIEKESTLLYSLLYSISKYFLASWSRVPEKLTLLS